VRHQSDSFGATAVSENGRKEQPPFFGADKVGPGKSAMRLRTRGEYPGYKKKKRGGGEGKKKENIGDPLYGTQSGKRIIV